MEKKKHPLLPRVCAGVFAALFGFFSGGLAVANAYSTWINSTLQTPAQKLQNDSGDVPMYFSSDYSTIEEMLAARSDLLKRISEEGSVLLKNENSALPIDTGSKVTLLGYGSADPIYGGMIGSTITEGGTQTKISIEQALSEIGIEVNPALTDFYSKNTAKRSMSSVMFGARYESLEDAVIGEVPVSSFVSAGIASGSGENAKLNNETIGDFSDAAIVVVSRRSSEAAEFNIGSATTEDGDSYDSPLDLTTYEKEVIKMAANSFDKVIVLINSDQALGIDAIKNDNDIDAILWAGLPGAEGFRGVASVIAGNANPSGHLPDTFAVHPASAPANSNFGMFTWSNASVNGGSSLTDPDNGKGDWYVVENENIYVGYKYYETRYADALSGDAEALDASNTTEYVKSYSDYDESIPWDYNTQVSYSFGYGLSYTEFDETLESVTIDGEGGVGLASVTVTNTGDVDGKAVVQLYVQAPYTMGGVEKVAIQLVDFTKVDVAAGESVNATIEFELSNFASYDTDKEQWVLEDGDYYFAIGNGAHEALNSVLLLQGNTDITVSTKEEKADAAMAKMISLGNVKSYMEVINENVENRFEQADYTNYDSSFNYITRSDWSKGWETIGTEDGKGQGAVAYTEEMEKGLYAQLYEITANDKTDDMNFAWDSGSGLKATQFIGVGIDETVNIDGTEYSYDDLVNTMSLQEACFLLENEYQNLDAIASIELGECVTNDGPAGFAYDQVPGYSYNWKEYESADPNYVASGDVNAQTSMAVYNTEPVVAATFNKELVYEEGKMFGEDSLWANENLVIGPGANLHRSAYNARNHEYYSEDSVLTNLLGVAFCEGAYTKGLMTQPKHYAFNHQEVNRIGTATFFNEQGGRELELRGFQGMMEKNVAQSVMTAFNRIGSEYAGANVGAMQGVARDEWGFEGFVVTDMVNGAMYMNWRDAFALGLSGTLGTNAYATTTLGASTSELNLKLIGDDAYLQQQIHDAVKYVLAAEMNSNFMNGMDATTRIVNVTPWWEIALIAATVITGILTVLAIVFYAGALGKEGKTNE